MIFIRMASLKRLKELKSKMSDEQKRKLLVSLKKLKEEVTGNVGGETDLSNADNSLTNENEFTGTGVTSTTEPNVIAKTFDTQADFDSYVNQRRGIQFTPKEIQAIQNHQEVRPTQLDRFQVRYETTDDFGNNDTTVIKKLKEGSLFCWTAFSKHETAEEEGRPEGSEPTNESDEPSEPEDSGDEEVTVNDPIRITKTITFTDETQGADVLADFLNKLEL
jgi:hypothetical protein